MEMNLARKAESGPALTISSAAELSFSTLAIGACCVISPNLRSNFISQMDSSNLARLFCFT
eukprot:4030586-Prorocentrum_lima.AAC.1